jgi:glycosyltransferase involved in cell wall biosynthesis
MVLREDVQGHVLIISHDVVGAQMAGPGIRYYYLALVLAREFDVVLAVPAGSSLEPSQDFHVLPYRSGEDTALEEAVRGARAAVAPAVWLAQAPSLLQSSVPLIVDGYDPFLAEKLSVQAGETSELQRVLAQAYLAGDFFICASERQRDWWLGLLEGHGRVNLHTFGEDRSLRRLVDVVPFGLRSPPPKHTRPVVKGVWPGIREQDRIILWGGGLWPWLDPLTAIRAAAKVWQHRQDVRLIFPGTRHPNPAMSEIPTHSEAALQAARELGLLNSAVFFGEWVPYTDWPSVLLESDVALTLHYDTLEARLAFRSRVLEYVWAGLPTVATRGDATSDLIAEHGIGIVVDYEDVDGVAGAMLHLLETPRTTFGERFERARQALTWERAAQPLVTFCRSPRRAPDKEAGCVGNPYYLDRIAHLASEKLLLKEHMEGRIAWLEGVVRGYESGKFIRFTRFVHRLREHLRQVLRGGN